MMLRTNMENTHIQARTHTHARELSGNRPAAMAHRVALRCQGPAACQRCRSLQPAQRQEVCRLSGEKTTRLLVKNFNALFNPRLSLCHPLARRDSAIGHACDLRWCWWAALGPGGGVGIKAKRFFFSLSLPKCGGNEKHGLFWCVARASKCALHTGASEGRGSCSLSGIIHSCAAAAAAAAASAAPLCTGNLTMFISLTGTKHNEEGRKESPTFGAPPVSAL